MPAYTDPLAIPYPVAGDSLRDAVSTIPQQAAEKVDDLLNALSSVAAVNWTNLVHTGGGWTASASPTAYARRAGMVTLNMGANKNGWIAGEIICTLPAGFRPSRPIFFTAVRAGDGVPAAVQVGSNGQVSTVLAAGAGAVGLVGAITFAV